MEGRAARSRSLDIGCSTRLGTAVMTMKHVQTWVMMCRSVLAVFIGSNSIYVDFLLLVHLSTGKEQSEILI